MRSSSIRGTQASLPVYLNYTRPSISKIKLSNGDLVCDLASSNPDCQFQTSGFDILVEGLNFGLNPNVSITHGIDPPGVTRAPRHCDIISATHTTISCSLGEGEGDGNTLSVVMSGSEQEVSSSVVPWKYEDPVLDEFVSSGALFGTIPTKGGAPIQIRGQNFGTKGPVVLINDLPCNVAGFSHTVLTCVSPEGDGANLNLFMSVSGLSSTTNLTISYTEPTLTSINPMNGPTAGVIHDFASTDWESMSQSRVLWDNAIQAVESQTVGLTITLSGENFGTEPVVSFGGEELPPSSIVSHSHEEVVINMPEGNGMNDVLIRAKDQSTAIPLNFVYDGPAPNGVYYPDCSPAMVVSKKHAAESCKQWEALGLWKNRRAIDPLAERRCTEPLRLLIPGVNYGDDKDDVSVYIDGELAVIQEHSHTSLLIEMPAGSGTDLNLTITVAGAADSSLSLSYDAPIVTAVAPAVPYSCRNEEGALDFVIAGLNFGTRSSNEEVKLVMDGVECVDMMWHAAQPGVFGSYPFLTCTRCHTDTISGVCRDNEQSGHDYVGLKNVSLTVARQLVHIPPSARTFQCKCPKDWYGQVSEVCLECPFGAKCTGKFDSLTMTGAEPMTLLGYWLLQVSPNNTRDYYAASGEPLCPPERLHRPKCPLVVPCDPEEACLGNNTCAVGYEGLLYQPEMDGGGVLPERCSDCTLGTHFAMDGKCEKCPEHKWLIPALFVVCGFAACILGFFMNKLDVNWAVVSIGIDFFQVLAVFASSEVTWPRQIRAIFRWMSAFNLNIDLAAPDCIVVPRPTFNQKWYIKLSVPFIADIFMVLAFVLYFILRYPGRAVMKVVRALPCVNSRASRKPLMTFDHVISLALAKYYLFYLFTTRLVIQVFNCSPIMAEADDGTLYETDGYDYMQSVLPDQVRCWEDDAHLKLVPFAVFAFFVNTIGFPLLTFLCLHLNRRAVMTDQYMKAQEKGNSKRTNPHYHIRMRYRNLYMYFKPRRYYWVNVIIGRKFMIAFTALVFKTTRAFNSQCA